jgi:two-component system cell cycle response regulator DivK
MDQRDDTTCVLDPVLKEEKQGRTVLIVEDDREQTQVLEHHLKGQGFATVAAGDGQAGVAEARQLIPDIVLLDLGLPDADGLDVCGQLADDPVTATIPVIILSGMEHPDIVRRSRAAGCSYYVRKPYDPNALLLLIEQAIHEAESW